MEQRDQARDAHEAGLDAYRAGEYEEALEAFALARNLFAQAGDRTGQIEALGSQGAISIELEEWEQAKQYLDQALALSEEQGDQSNQGKILGNLGMMYARQGQEEAAAEAYQEAIAIFQETGERGYEKDVARQLSKLKLKKGKVLEALEDSQLGLEGEAEASGAQKMARKLFRLFGRVAGGPLEADADEEEIGAGQEDRQEDDDPVPLERD
jgi:tetratricopeptide (TPR) repeat protein